MNPLVKWWGVALSLSLLLVALPSAAQQPGQVPPGRERAAQPMPPGRPPVQVRERAQMPGQQARPPAPPHPLEQARQHGGDEHGGDEHGGHDAAPKPINWYHGFLGKKEGVEPSLLWRSPDQDAPYLAALLNFAVFAYVIYHFGRKPVQEALTRRKQGIVRDIEAAQKMREDAEKRLKEYETRLEKIDSEIERIRVDFREQGERDKQRIIQDAEEKRDRMLKDAQFLIEQESKQLRVTLLRETVDAAVLAAEQILRGKITAEDHDRLAEEFLKQMAASRGATVTRGGNA